LKEDEGIADWFREKGEWKLRRWGRKSRKGRGSPANKFGA